MGQWGNDGFKKGPLAAPAVGGHGDQLCAHGGCFAENGENFSTGLQLCQRLVGQHFHRAREHDHVVRCRGSPAARCVARDHGRVGDARRCQIRHRKLRQHRIDFNARNFG